MGDRAIRVLYKRDVGDALTQLPPSGHGRARGLVSSRVSGARVEAERYAPPADLADVVESFWMGRWDLPPEAPHVTELLSDPSVHLVVEYGATRVAGIWTQRWTNRLEGQGQVRSAKLRPGAVRAFFDIEAVALTDRFTDPRALIPDFDPAAIERNVLGPSDDRAGFTAMADCLRALRRKDEEVGFAVQAAATVREPGMMRVEALADRCGVSVRSLQRLFRRHVGTSPKALLRRIRIQEAALRIERGEATCLATLASDLGYTDQAHLTRDFRTTVGRTPRNLEASLYR